MKFEFKGFKEDKFLNDMAVLAICQVKLAHKYIIEEELKDVNLDEYADGDYIIQKWPLYIRKAYSYENIKYKAHLEFDGIIIRLDNGVQMENHCVAHSWFYYYMLDDNTVDEIKQMLECDSDWYRYQITKYVELLGADFERSLAHDRDLLYQEDLSLLIEDKKVTDNLLEDKRVRKVLEYVLDSKNTYLLEKFTEDVTNEILYYDLLKIREATEYEAKSDSYDYNRYNSIRVILNKYILNPLETKIDHIVDNIIRNGEEKAIFGMFDDIKQWHKRKYGAPLKI